MNNMNLLGRIAKTPETRTAGNTAITTLIVATDRVKLNNDCLLYTSPSPRDRTRSRMPSSA